MTGYFVTGTDTGVGKTVASCCLALGTGGAYWKPIQSGLDHETDSQWVSRFLSQQKVLPEIYKLSAPLSPHHAAEQEGVKIILDQISPPPCPATPLIVEGAGGVLVPINKDYFIIDLIEKLKLPCIVVARSELGTLNHTLLTLRELKRYNVTIKGVILNGEKNTRNRQTIEERGDVKVLLEMEKTQKITSEFLINQFNKMEFL